MNQQTLKQLHDVEVEILDEIVRICEKHDLHYYLVGGTLLGAARHKGFIPWDDDLDIGMPRDDYQKFEAICKEELSKDFYVHSYETDKNYWLPFIKVRKSNTVFDEALLDDTEVEMNGIWVDIFPLDKVSSLDSWGKRQRTKIIKTHLQHFISYKKHHQWPQPIVSKIIYALLTPMSLRTLRKIQDFFMMWENKKDCKYYINYGSQYNPIKQTILKTDYEPTCKIEFEGKMYMAPGNYKNVLTRIYGEDYMELPPIEKRVTHRPLRISFDTTGPDAPLD